MHAVERRSGHYKSFDGTEIYYEDRGRGRPIVLCSGLACPMNHWTHQVRHFSGNHRLVMFDYRGHGRSGTPMRAGSSQIARDRLNVAALAEDLHGLLRHLEIERASFWGHSYGVPVILKYLSAHPDAAKNLVFINGFATTPIRTMFSSVVGPDTVTKAFEGFRAAYEKAPRPMKLIWRASLNNPLAVPISALIGGFNPTLTRVKDIETYMRGVGGMDVSVFVTLFEEMIHFDMAAEARKVNVPTLIFSGEGDAVTPPDLQKELHSLIKKSELCRVPYGSHCTQLDMPEFLNLRIEKFLGENMYS